MYHYVRDLARSRYPALTGLDLAAFVGQLEHLRRHHTFVGVPDVVAAYREGTALPPDACLLTFDDGYVDGFTNVFPLLDAVRVPAAFFPVASAVEEGRVLDVNKIHFVIAARGDARALVAELFELLDRARRSASLPSNDEYYARHAQRGRWDGPDAIFLKRMLQRVLPEPLRCSVLDELFRRHVTTDERGFAAQLYMSADQLRCLARHGMYVGSHGYDHRSLAGREPPDLDRELDQSLAFLRRVGSDHGQDRVMCYPFGDVDDTVKAALRARGFVLGLTTRPDVAQASDDPLEIPRLDTNDLPKPV